MKEDEAFQLITHALESGHVANAYLLVGRVRGVARQLADRVLKELFPTGSLRVQPDIHYLAPEMKSRTISVESMRQNLLDPLSRTAYQGGWRAGLIQDVDRLGVEGANVFLKTLEEPPSQTIFLLLTERPEKLLPTILSRCQRIDLPRETEEPWFEAYRSRILTELASPRLKESLAQAAAASRLSVLLAELKDKAEASVNEELEESNQGPGYQIDERVQAGLIEARYKEFRLEFLLVMQSWFRDLMTLVAVPPARCTDETSPLPLHNESFRATLISRAAHLSLAQAFRNLTAIEEFATSLERNVPEQAALFFALDRLVFGTV